MNGVEFFDSNIFVYLFDDSDTRKRGIARARIDHAVEASTGCVSWQVVQETLNVITRKIKRPASTEQALRFMHATLLPHRQVLPNAKLLANGLHLKERYGYSFYDSLIVAAALEAQCTCLLTEDFQHGQQIEGLTIENPFLDAPG